jgi:hypothetical protein
MPYVAEWYRSLCEQTDTGFQLWIGLDQLKQDSVEGLLGRPIEAKWVEGTPGVTPAQIRQAALAQIVDSASEVVLVDSDDLLHPTRVAAARSALATSELAGCALRLVDQRGEDLGSTFNLPPRLQPEDVFPRNNVFGFSNSAYRTDLLKRTLPIPAGAILVDWFIATRAWLIGANLSFDREPRMDYRQHPKNMALVRLPFSPDQVTAATALVCDHFRLLLAEPAHDFVAERYIEFKRAAGEVEEFKQRVIPDPILLANYVKAFNSLAKPLVWWSCVAHPDLNYLWAR